MAERVRERRGRYAGLLDDSDVWRKSDPEFQGLRAVSIVNREYRLLDPISGVDITDWHTYSVIWEEGNGTFLIDGETVATTSQVPERILEVWISNSGLRLAGPLDHVTALIGEISTDQCMQIDYIRLFTVPDPVPTKILGLILLPALLRRR